MKTTLITGAGRRIGAVVARHLAGLGYAMAIHYRNSSAEAAQLVEAIRLAGGQAELFHADLAQPRKAEGLIEAVFERYGRLDVLINNAALFAYDTLANVDEEKWNNHLSTNLTAPIFLIKAYAAKMGQGDRGLVINMLDQKVAQPNPDYFSYTAAKIALAGLTPVLALALAPRIRVCGVAPNVALPSGEQNQDDFTRAAAATPSGITSSAEDIAAAVQFIVETPSFSGQVLTIDGGESLIGRPRDVAYDPGV